MNSSVDCSAVNLFFFVLKDLNMPVNWIDYLIAAYQPLTSIKKVKYYSLMLNVALYWCSIS